jgi:phosphoglucosamine mutase
MSIDRIQGTDGIRRPVALASDPRVRGLTPQAAFLEEGLITEEFVELYAYAYVSGLEQKGEIVIGWDPRDPAGDFTGAAVRGIRKAGAAAVAVGICPTPGVALYLVWRGAAAAFMVTASHNFRDQNGIKIFRGGHALKLFPEDDRALTRRVLALDYARDVAPRAETGGRIDAGEEARDVFRRFHLDPRNSWLADGESLGDFPLVVDAANGAMSGIAADVLRALHGGEVVEVNQDTASGDVNRQSGVADLEGVPEIARGERRFAGHKAVQLLFERGGKAAVFDADGDRFYRLDHDRESDTILVLSGDETAVHQARYLAPPAPGTLYINTVESDLNAARAAQALGYAPVLTGVGDKWVLEQAAKDPVRYGIGSEETGHNVSRGHLTTRAGEDVEVFVGNGLKSALNTFVATRGLSPRDAHRPFEPGFKRTFYVYYTDKGKLFEESPVFRGVAGVIERECTLGPTTPQPRPEERDMLYLAVHDGERQRAGIFVRNSGTEEKTGVNVRGAREDGDELSRIGEAAVLFLAREMKDVHHPMARAEKAVLQALAGGPRARDELPIPPGIHAERLLEEMANKEKVIRACPDGFERTELGRRMLEAWQ